MSTVIKKATAKRHKLECHHNYDGIYHYPRAEDVETSVRFYEDNKEVSHAHVAKKYGIEVIEKLLGYAYIV